MTELPRLEKNHLDETRLVKITDMALLADFYGALLTEKQRQALQLFYEEDFSLTEIAESCACTRQAAHDLIKRSEALLAEYEQKLGLLARHKHQKCLFDEAENNLLSMGISPDNNFWNIWRLIKEGEY